MSFLSVITKVGHVIKTGTDIASPFLPLIPGGSVLNTVLQVIFTAESVITQTGAGSLKKETVMAMLHAALPNANPARLSQAVDLIVAAVNLLSNVTADPVPLTGTGALGQSLAFPVGGALGSITTGTVITGPGVNFPGSSITYTKPPAETLIQTGPGYTAPQYK